MLCPLCREPLVRTKDTRSTDTYTRRSKLCANGHRVTTYEAIQKPDLKTLYTHDLHAQIRRYAQTHTLRATAKHFHLSEEYIQNVR